MIYLSKILPLFVLPVGAVLLLLAGGLLLKRRALIIIGTTLLLVCSLPVVAGALTSLIEGTAVRLPVDGIAPADAVVVLSTGRSVAPGPERISEWTDADRFFAGIDLFGAKKAPLLVFTGGTAPWVSGPLEGDVLRSRAVAMGVPPERVTTTGAVVNTAEEAAAVSAQLSRLSASPRIILVTSAFHMPRAMRLFTRAGLTVTPFPVDFSDAQDSLSILDLLPGAGSLAQTQVALRELYGRAYYRWVAR